MSQSKIVPIHHFKASTQNRRTFMRTAATGAAGAVLALSNADRLFAQGSESGHIIVDAMLLTYVGSPLGTLGASGVEIGRDYAVTFRIRSTEDPGISLKARIPIERAQICLPGKQQKSALVKNALTWHQSFECGALVGAGTRAPGSPDHTFFSGIFNAKFVVEGSPKKLRFRFGKSTGRFGLVASGLRDGSLMSRETGDSILSQYVTDSAALVAPRFQLRETIFVFAGEKREVTISEPGDSRLSKFESAVVTASIKEASGFTSERLRQAFRVGSNIEITYYSAQEFESDAIITLKASLERAENGINKVYWDRVFKTFVIIDGGPPALSSVSGKITDKAGAAVGGATVKLRSRGVAYSTLTDADGNYTIATPQGEPLEQGLCLISCGDQIRQVWVDDRGARADLSGVEPSRVII